MVKKSIRYTIELSPELNEAIERMAEDTHATKSEVFRRALTLFEVVIRARREGKRFGLADPGQPLATEIIGI